MAQSIVPPPSQLTKIPPNLADRVLRRGEWTFCAMDHSRIDAIEFDAPSAPFHHLALPLERVSLRLALHVDGRRRVGRTAPDTVTMIEAGAAGLTRWDASFESACLYFGDAGLRAALSCEDVEPKHLVRTQIEHESPILARLLHALYCDAAAGQPHGTLIGDSIFIALAAALVPQGEHRRLPSPRSGEPWRVRNAIAFIHDRLTEHLDIGTIAHAAGTSPFYLNRTFRQATGCSVWQYVMTERARCAFRLLRDPRLNLTEVAHASGFENYASFIAVMRNVFGHAPAKLRKMYLVG